MCNCCNRNNCCRWNVIRQAPIFVQGSTGPTGPRGPTGFTGPTGPTGPTGSAFASSQGYFVNVASQAVASNADIPLASNVVLNGTDISKIAGSSSATLQPGTYIISYNTDAVVPAGGTSALVALFVNGVSYAGQTSTQTATAGSTVNLSGTAVVVLGFAQTVSLRNTGALSTNFSNTALSVVKLN